MNTGTILWEHLWWIYPSLLPRYGTFCQEWLYINMFFNGDLSSTRLCKMQRSRSVGQTVLQLSHILLFHGKIHFLLLLYLLKDFFFLLLYSAFYNTIFIGWHRPRLKSECLSVLQKKSVSHHFNYFPMIHSSLWSYFYEPKLSPTSLGFYFEKANCGSEQYLHCAKERKNKAWWCNRYNMKPTS